MRKPARDLRLGDRIVGLPGQWDEETETVVTVAALIRPSLHGHIFVWDEGDDTDEPATLILSQGDEVEVDDDLGAVSTPALVRELIDLKVWFATPGGHNAARHNRLGAVVTELRRRGVLD